MKKTKPFLYVGILFIGVILSCKTDPTSQTHSTGVPALDELNTIISKDSLDHSALYARAEYFYQNEDYDAAIADLEMAIDIDNNIPAYYHLLSDTYLDYYRSKEAVQVLERAAEQFPERILTLLKLSETQHILKQYDPSLFTLARILTVDSQNAEAYFMMGLNFRSMGETNKAINAFQTATELNPELLDAWLILGKLFENEGNPLAADYYNAAINVNPDEPSTWHSKAFYLQNNNRIPEALEIYKRINTIDKYYLDAYLNAGILYMELDSFENAYDQFNIMTQLKSQNFIGYYYRGLASKALGQMESAIADMQNCLNLNPEFERAQTQLKELQAIKS